MTGLVIWGCGGMAREVNLLCEQRGDRVIGFLDERSEMKGKVVDGVPVLGDIADIEALREEVEVVCAGVGKPALKRRFAEKTAVAGFKIANALIHPGVYVSRLNSIGEGSVICEGAVLTVNVQIGAHVIVNRVSTVGHDVRISDYASIMPGVVVSGDVSIGEGVFVGAGAVVREKIMVGEWATVGGGAFVKDDVPSNQMVAGVPATFKKASS